MVIFKVVLVVILKLQHLALLVLSVEEVIVFVLLGFVTVLRVILPIFKVNVRIGRLQVEHELLAVVLALLL